VNRVAAVAATRTRPRIDLGSFIRLTELADYFVPFTIRAICQLGVADHLADGPLSVEVLARRTQTDPPSLLRALRALACKGIFTECEPETFDLTSLAELLREDHPLSLRDAYHLMPADVLAWANLGYSLRTGEPAFDRVHGQSLWSYLATHPEDSARFDRGMQAMTRPELRAVSAAYDWARLGRIVDVGGGNGAFLAGLLAHHRSLRGVLFDLPHVVAGSQAVLEAAGVAERCEVIAGSFFETVPPDADAYVLKRILYGWNDDGALTLLRAVRMAMGSGSRVLLLEPLVQTGDMDGFASILDLVMLVVDGGRARGVAELTELFDLAGLRLTRVIPTMMFPIVEGQTK
jgi:hypothetical protein